MNNEKVISLLEPLLTENRVNRMRQVLAARSDHVAFVFERMTDPHNMSAALRSLDAFSFQDAHWVQPGERLQPGPARGITIGSDRWLSMHRHADTRTCLDALKEKGYTVLASHLGQAPSVSLHELDFTRPLALVFGNEHAGVSEEVLELADGNFRIEMNGFVESLNLSVAVAVTAFHARGELERLAGESGDPDRFRLSGDRKKAIYARWLKGSVKRSDRILSEAGIDPEL